tara:strand:+ start:769 stop:1413 length:645 start_codon:yes stop_codon:yes gene_type:complete
MSIKLQHSGGNSVSLNPPTSAPTSSEVAFKLPNADGSANQVVKTDGSGNLAFTSLVSGITEFDYWYLTSGKSDNSDVTANLSRVALTGSAAQIGTGMSESSGIFTFPSTGKYLVLLQAQWEIYGDDNCSCSIKVTTDNSSYTEIAKAIEGNTSGQGGGSTYRVGSSSVSAFLDVTDTSNVKVKFTTGSLGTNSYLKGSASVVNTGFIFTRIGDT